MREERAERHIREGDGRCSSRPLASVPRSLRFGPNILYTCKCPACVLRSMCFFFHTENQLSGLSHVVFTQSLLKLRGKKLNY